jgi:hypothetical protein
MVQRWSKLGESEPWQGNSGPKAGHGRSTVAVSLSNCLMAIEPGFVARTKSPHVPQSMFSVSKDAIHPSARLEPDKPFISSGLLPICHVATSCDYRETFISAKFTASPLN